MRRSLRLCLVVLLIGLSLLVVTVVRVNSVPRLMNFSNEEEGAICGWVLFSDFLMFDRDFSVNIRANNTVSVYILDDVAIKQWHIDRSVNAVWVYEDVVVGTFNEPSYGRGGYAVLVYLPEDSVTVIKVVLTFYSFEKDLLRFSLVLVGVGIFSLVATALRLLIKIRSIIAVEPHNVGGTCQIMKRKNPFVQLFDF